MPVRCTLWTVHGRSHRFITSVVAIIGVAVSACSDDGAFAPAAADPSSPHMSSNIEEDSSQPFRVKDPEKDPLPADERLAALIVRGAEIFMDTPDEAQQYAFQTGLSCTNCHLNGGQKTGALPLVGIATQFPQWNNRSQRTINLTERIQGCFKRSLNGHAPPADSDVANALVAYLTWISEGYEQGQTLPWRGQNRIAGGNKLPIDQLDVGKGRQLYEANCADCHKSDGQGSGSVPPLWGSESFNDGAGMARVYTAAGFIRYAMPRDNPGKLDDIESQHVAAYINSMDRPVYGTKDQDYVGVSIPVDAVYYPQLYPTHPLR